MEFSSLDFDLTIEHTDDGYFTRVLDSPAGEAVSPFRPPFTVADLDQLQRVMAEPAPGVDLAAQAVQARDFGELIFQAVFQPNIRTCFEESLRLAYAARARLRVRLHLASTPEFADLPWEYLYDRSRQEYLALATYGPLIRYLDRMHQIVPCKAVAPLRMLVVIPSPGGHPLFDAEQLWFDLVDTLDHLAVEGRLRLELLVKPTLHDLQRHLRQQQYHLLHIVAHSAYSSQSEENLLLFEDEMGRTRQISGKHLAALVHDHFPLRLVTVQACPLARPGRPNAYVGLAKDLVHGGLPAAIAIQAVVGDKAGLAFADALYSSLANNTAVDSAMSEARRALRVNEQSTAWGATVLVMRVADGRLFDLQQPPQEVRRRPRFAFRRTS